MEYKKHIMIIYGTEPYVMEESRKRFLAAAHERARRSRDSVFQKDAVSGDGRRISSRGRVSFSSGTVTIWYDCPFLPLNRGGRSRSKLTKDEQWFLDEARRLSDENSLLFYSKGKMDTGSAFFKALKPMADVVAAEAVTEKTVMPYVTDYLKGKGKRLTSRAVAYLRALFQTWGDISLLYVFSELEKLCITVPDSRKTVDVRFCRTSLPGRWKRISSPLWMNFCGAMGKDPCLFWKACSAGKMLF